MNNFLIQAKKLIQFALNMSVKQWIIVICAVIFLVSICDYLFSEQKPAPMTYVEAVANNDFKRAHEILDDRLENAINLNANDDWKADDALEKFWAAADHIYKAEMMYLIEMKDSEANKRLINTLAMMNVIGNKPSQKMSAYGGGIFREENYSIFVTRFNRLCDEILNISILNNNKEMAQSVLALYKEDCSAPYKKDGDDDHYYFDFSTKSKDAALKKFKEAEKNGMLK